MFGNPQAFAVQVDLEVESEIRDCRVFYWIDGEPFGDPLQPVEVLSMVSQFVSIVKDGGRRFDDALDHLPDAEAFRLIDEHMHGDEPFEVVEMAARFNFVPHDLNFPGLAGYAVERDGLYRLLLGDREGRFERTRYCPGVALEDALFDAYMYLNSAVPMRHED
ncbi:hypothetical protein GVN21_01840 [Caulobacter sp. SLTY]|uniref:Imm42 family immunity protein n=1 Tax=Caulobacter sp. SLTY TaxID=2683262 RepID=UPI0014127AD7|nr:Imm42 family immunity protein [Caulobacter sp. SLTY]NBB14094.1 hypothetical protein [Caulobacter sp. SLTY]